MAISTSCARSFLRSSCFRKASSTPRFAPQAKPSSFQLPKQNPLSNPIFRRSPVELSSCVESMMPFHTATASALLTSMLAVSRPGCGWILEGKIKTS